MVDFKVKAVTNTTTTTIRMAADKDGGLQGQFRVAGNRHGGLRGLTRAACLRDGGFLSRIPVVGQWDGGPWGPIRFNI